MRDSKRALARLVAMILAFAMVATACGGGSDDETSAEPAESASVSTTDDGDSSESSSDDSSTEEAAEPEPEPEPETEAIVEVPEELIEEPAEEAGSDGPVAGGTLRYALEAEVDGINPTSSALSAPGLLMGQHVFDTLAAFDVDGNFVPWLAQSFTPNDDFTVWTVALREGISFHDGTPLNSEAIVVNFETQRNDPLVGLAVRPFYPAEDALTVIDDLSLSFNLLTPDANFPAALTGQLGMVASPTWIAAAVEEPTLNQQPVGTGPFMFESRNQDSVTTFVRNDSWWNGEVWLDAVEFVPVTDPDIRTDLLLEGEIDALQTTNPESIEVMRDEDFVNNVLDDTGDESFIMINSSTAPFDDIRVRQALTFATPRQNYLRLIGAGIQREADQMFTPESPFYNPDVEQEGDNPDAATPLIAEYCGEFADNCTDGRVNMELQYSGPSVVQTRIAELLDEGWKDHFNVTFQELPQDSHIQEVAFGLYNVVTWRQFGAVDPTKDRCLLYTSPSPRDLSTSRMPSSA